MPCVHPVRKSSTGAAVTEMVRIAGARINTPNYNSSLCSHAIDVQPFSVDPTETTNRQYGQFIEETGYFPPEEWEGGWYAEETGNRPVTSVSFVDAMFYCAWRGVRLPTSDEWHLAAFGNDGHQYPWGKDFDPQAFAGETPVVNVGSFPKSAGPNGLEDVIGNAWEWTTTPLFGATNGELVKGSAFVYGGGTLALKKCAYFTESSSWLSFGEATILAFWDSRVGIPSFGTGTMWGAYITSAEYSYESYGGGQFVLGSGIEERYRKYPNLCAAVLRLSVRAESVGFRCAAN